MRDHVAKRVTGIASGLALACMLAVGAAQPSGSEERKPTPASEKSAQPAAPKPAASLPVYRPP